MYKFKENRKKIMLGISMALGVLLILTLAALAPMFSENRKMATDNAYYEGYMEHSLRESDYPARLAVIALSYKYYKTKVDWDYYTEEMIESGHFPRDIEDDINLTIPYGLPDNYSIPAELVDEELIETLKELATEDFLNDYQRDSLNEFIARIE